ncbi:MAG: PstA family ABC transporter permease [Acidithiobacillus sp.]|jgi:phosphate transport system permease protein|uniref:PstA family ABC transporter permease n=1 Tax=Acidithiobacillus ferruginosus TaxID=3063951 RepID=A0ACD5IGA1_9PROT|nr:PstA family ABC transporter permease [Acidithiobacillus ferruginosus]MBU2813719.1 phosphate ABC transporter permease PstA [Acidithiobacillus ferruginosus]
MASKAVESSIATIPRAKGFKVSLYRRAMSAFAWLFVVFSFVFLAAMFISIVGDVVIHAWPALTPKLLTDITNGIGGGLKNAIEGSIVMSVGALLLAAPIGISAGIYLSEHGQGGAGKMLRFLSDVLVGIPSIVLGYVGYITMVIYLGWQFSVAAGIITLTVMLLPYIARSTELAMANIPLAVREAGYGLGAGEGRVALQILLPGAAPAIMTGLFYAVALSMGETAPLLYTAGWSNYMWNGQFTKEPIGYLTYVIWTFINEPFAESHMLAFAAAFLITGGVLILILAGRWLLIRGQRRMGVYQG